MPLQKLAFCPRSDYSFAMRFFYLMVMVAVASVVGGRECGFDDGDSLMRDLMIVDYWDCRLKERLPVHYNHMLQGGYFSMPSARVGDDGEVSLGYAHVPPYRHYNLRCQLTPNAELSFNYRIFKGVSDPVLTPLGFGDFSDKGANIKVAVWRPEDSDYLLPGVAFGFDDFLGTRSFKANYVVMTKVFRELHAEATLGWGSDRIRGFFGGLSWMPLLNHSCSWLRGFILAAEYDAIPYKSKSHEPHPDGRVKHSPLNFGIKYRLGDYFDFSASYIRGAAFACTASVFYNLGTTQGLLPKIQDPLPYRAPINREPLGPLRSSRTLAEELASSFGCQGFEILGIWLGNQGRGASTIKTLRIQLYNEKYRTESDVRNRLNHLLAYLMPADIDKVIVVIDSEGFSIQEYHFWMEYVRAYGDKCMGRYEVELLTPCKEVSHPDLTQSTLLYKQKRDWWNLAVIPNLYSFFGSAKGKFKYAIGMAATLDGFLCYDIYYALTLGYMIFHDIDDMQGVDRLNPSQLINVRTDIINYIKRKGLSLHQMYLQKNWNLGRAIYGRLGAGLFEREYGGFAGELLYYPLSCCWAVGIEGAVVKKRTYDGIGFTDKIRKLNGFIPSYRKFLGTQAFFNIYYDCRDLCVELRAKMGQFLAKDIGVRYEVIRYFESGMRLTMWYTRTNGKDFINGERYYDKGVMISIPLDIFYTNSERKRWNYGMSAWLRDVGQFAYTGRDLYTLINEQRQN